MVFTDLIATDLTAVRSSVEGQPTLKNIPPEVTCNFMSQNRVVDREAKALNNIELYLI